MKRLGFILSLLLVAVGLLSACGQASSSSAPAQGAPVQTDGGVFFNVTPVQLSAMLKSKDFLMVNVHIPYAGEIAGTDLFVPYNEIQANLSKFPADKSAKIVLYCRSGNMSGIASKEMVKLGFTNIWNVVGGMEAWKMEGKPLLQKQK